jgi:exonuclease III
LSARDIRRISRRLGWFEKLRDGLQKGADIGWFVVVCGDEERASPEIEIGTTSEDTEEEDLKTPRSAGLRSFFGTVSRKKSIPEE